MITNNKKIVLIHNIYSPHIEPVFRELSQKCNLHVLYCAEREENRTWKSNIGNYHHSFLKGFSLKLRGKDLLTLFVNFSVFKSLDNLKPDLVILSGWDLPTYWFAAFYCKRNHIPYIVWSGSTIHETSWQRSASVWLVKLVLRNANGFIAYGQRARDYLVHLGANPEMITIAGNGFDFEYFHDYRADPQKITSLKEKFKLKNKKVILFYGQLIERKNPGLLISAFKLLKQNNPDLALILVGSGPLRDALNKEILSAGIKDTWVIDNVGDDIIRNYYAIANVFVLPSVQEVWGLVVNQALASQLPVVVSDAVGCLPELVEGNSNAFSFQSGNVQALASSLERALQLRKAKSISQNHSINRVKLCIPSNVANQVIIAIQQVLEPLSERYSDVNITLPMIEDDCKLTFAQQPYIPFPINRVYYIQDSLGGMPRGFHAHKSNIQAFFCIQGSVNLLLDDGVSKKMVRVSSPNNGILINKGVWHEMHNISDDAIMMVFASEPYNGEDYIRNYSDFLLYKLNVF